MKKKNKVKHNDMIAMCRSIITNHRLRASSKRVGVSSCQHIWMIVSTVWLPAQCIDNSVYYLWTVLTDRSMDCYIVAINVAVHEGSISDAECRQ